MRATALMIAALLPLTAAAHPGGLAADGCHNDRKNGGRHCHRPPGVSAPPAERPQRQQRLSGAGSYFANCSAARAAGAARSEEHTSELQSLMRISYAVFCLKKKTT